VQRHFEVQNISDAVKVKLAKLSMEGATIHWFNLLRETEDHLSWSIFKQALIERYGGRRFDNPFEELSDLRQGGSVDDYIAEFEYLSSQVGRLPEEQYLGYFMGGLRLEIRRCVRTFSPQTRPQMMRVVRDVEVELYGVSQEGKGAGSRFQNHDKGSSDRLAMTTSQGWVALVGPMTKGNVVTNQSIRNGKEERRLGAERSRGLKHLSYQELMERKAKGLCFRCGEKFHPMHQCSEKQLRMLILGEDETMDEGEGMTAEVNREEEVEPLECNTIGLGGVNQDLLTGVKTMRMEGKLRGVTVVVMIDSGASHNFISPRVAAALDLSITPTKDLRIRLGDGHQVMTRGKCSDLVIQLADSKFNVDAYVLELGGLDVILGVAWLKGFGKVMVDWKEMTMEFLYLGRTIHLQGLNCELHKEGFNVGSTSFNSILQQNSEENEKIKGEDIDSGIVSQLTIAQERDLLHLLEMFPAVF